jgi:hypothetical protein
MRSASGNGAHGAAADSRTMESPLAFHPHSETLVASRAAPPNAASAPAAAIDIAPAPNANVESAFTNSFARLVAETPSGRTAIVQDSPEPTTHRISDPRPEISLDWPIEARWPWLKIGIALATLVVVAGGGWRYFSRKEKPATSAVVAPSMNGKPFVAAPTDTFAIKHPSQPVGPPASVVKPGVASVIIPSSKAEGSAGKTASSVAKSAAVAPAPSTTAQPPDGSVTQDPPAAHSSAKVEDTESVIKAPKMPTIKVDAITKMIDDSARRRADSVGNVIQQKPPTFKPKVYKSP